MIKNIKINGESFEIGAADKEHTHKAEDIGAAPAYTYGTDDLTAGTSELATGKLHFVYE